MAHNEERNLEPAVRSLIDQDLPREIQWKSLWIIASGCSDRTVEVGERLAQEDGRVHLIVEPERSGKAHALREVFRRAEGDALVLLNADARAEPGSVAELVRVGMAHPAPFAVMARPVVPPGAAGRWVPTFRWMWDLHHEFHAEILAKGDGGHLSDELLLVSLPEAPQIPDGIINDGSYFAIWLSQHDGGRWYASDARVSIQIPCTVRDHLHQRRRIHVGNVQVTSTLGAPPTTLLRGFFERPAETARLLRRMLGRKEGVTHFARLATWELASQGLAAWDQLPPRKDHVRWQRIRPSLSEPRSSTAIPSGGSGRATAASSTERRVASLLRVAGAFGTGVPLQQLQSLLPTSGPETVEGFTRWLEERPQLARLDGSRVFAPDVTTSPAEDRAQRAQQYCQWAESLWNGPLSFNRGLVRCAAITGSVAFGEPLPGDDLDFFVVTASGSLWWFLARSYFALFLARRRDHALGGPAPCLNYVIEDGAAAREFAQQSDLLFAREALSVHVLRGADYYRGLVASGVWMRAELPHLYDARSQAPGDISPECAPWSVRLLNLIAFPLLASYLHIVGLARNSSRRLRALPASRFRTETGRRRLAFVSHRFERLRTLYADPSVARTPYDDRESTPVVHATR